MQYIVCINKGQLFIGYKAYIHLLADFEWLL